MSSECALIPTDSNVSFGRRRISAASRSAGRRAAFGGGRRAGAADTHKYHELKLIRIKLKYSAIMSKIEPSRGGEKRKWRKEKRTDIIRMRSSIMAYAIQSSISTYSIPSISPPPRLHAGLRVRVTCADASAAVESHRTETSTINSFTDH